MKINYIKINGFGKLKNKFIKFEDGINIVYGENETGKSTIVKFLTSVLYGISKNKNGRPLSDFDQYQPWDSSEFSGKINYEINGEEFEAFREFNKKNPKIFNVKGEDISKKFEINKSKEIEYFTEQSKIDENTFLNTAVIEQENIEVRGKSANSIVQKLSNLVSTGNDNISFQKSLSKIEKEQNENVGTDKTKNKPINIVENDINRLLIEKNEIENYKDRFESDLIEKEKNDAELENCQNKKMCLRFVKKFQDEVKLKSTEVEFNKKNENEYSQKVEQLKNQIERNYGVNSNKKSSNKIVSYIIMILCVIAATVIFMNGLSRMYMTIPGVLFVISLIFSIVKNKKSKKFESKEKEKLENEYEKMVIEYEEKKKTREESEQNLYSQIKNKTEEIKMQFREKLGDEFLKKIFEMNEIQIEKYSDELENSVKNLSIQYQILQNEINEIDLKLEKLVNIEEDLESKCDEKNELVSLNTSYEIAKECLENAYNEIKNNLSPKFERKLCEISDKITNGKYKNIILNEENGLFVEVENGNYMPIDRLSVGTIDELYLALRLSILDEISPNEKMPIIFDETFAYFDDNRIANTLTYLLENNYENQIVIFTCSNREEKILNNMKVDYNFVKLEKN